MQSRGAPFYIGPLLTSRVYQGQFIPVSRGVVSDANELLGVAAAGVEPAEFVRLLSEQALPDGYSLRLLLNSGDVLACFPSGGDCTAQMSKRWSYCIPTTSGRRSSGRIPASRLPPMS